MSEPFTGMTEDARVFYSRVFNEVLLNLHAVRMGYFDTYLCETTDPNVVRRWHQDLRHVRMQVITALHQGR